MTVLNPSILYFLSDFFSIVGAIKITIKAVVPIIMDDKAAKAMLGQDLDRMECVGLLQAPLCLKDANMVQELVQRVPNQFEGTNWASQAKRMIKE